jgi:hypothetical protein
MLRDQGAMISEQGKALARIDETVHNSQHQLFGNGQPGIIQILSQRHENMETKFGELDAEIGDLRNDLKIKKAYVLGYGSAIGTFVTLTSAWLGKKFGIHL